MQPIKGQSTSKTAPASAVDPYAVAAIRLLHLTAARLREIFDAAVGLIDVEARR